MGKPEYTEAKIESTFFNLLESKRFEDITLKELLEEAHISKTTFYRYYKDLFAIFDVAISRDLETFEENTTNEDFYEKLATMIKSFHEKRKTILHIVYSDFNNTFSKNILRFFQDLSKKYAFMVYGPDIPDEQKEKIAERIGYEMFGRFVDWVISGMKEDLSSHIESISQAMPCT